MRAGICTTPAGAIKEALAWNNIGNSIERKRVRPSGPRSTDKVTCQWGGLGVAWLCDHLVMAHDLGWCLISEAVEEHSKPWFWPQPRMWGEGAYGASLGVVRTDWHSQWSSEGRWWSEPVGCDARHWIGLALGMDAWTKEIQNKDWYLQKNMGKNVSCDLFAVCKAGGLLLNIYVFLN